MSKDEYLDQLKEITDEIRKKDPSEHTWEDKWYLWQEKIRTSPPDFPYDVGEERYFYDGKALANNEIKNGFGDDFPKWFQEAGNNFGKKCIAPDNEIYTLIGMSETFEDYYYILQDDEGKKHFHTCVGGIKYI